MWWCALLLVVVLLLLLLLRLLLLELLLVRVGRRRICHLTPLCTAQANCVFRATA